MGRDPTDDRDAEIARLRATVAELLDVVADLRRQVEAQQAHIHRLVKLTFGPAASRWPVPPRSTTPPCRPKRCPATHRSIPPSRHPPVGGTAAAGWSGSHPAFANRCVYARNDKELVCVSLAP